ncbi:MAG: hypothetical protein AAFV53_38695, partial [Myxococcota bacterium]
MFIQLLGWSLLCATGAAKEWAPEGSPVRLPAFEASNAEAQRVEAEMMRNLLREFNDRSSQVFLGEVLDAHHPNNDPIRGTQITFAVSGRMKGQTPLVVDVLLPPPGDYVAGDPLPMPVTVVEGYQMLVFMDRHNEIVASNALFLVRGGHIWRNKREETFLDPLRDREWSGSIDPYDDYILI